MNLLRVATAGNIDDGKSTLLGRLLFETGNLFDDQLIALKMKSEKKGFAEDCDFSLVTDGLRSEQERGITIDVAHRPMNLLGKRIQLADSPGHQEYTKQMVTAASTADLLLLMIDVSRPIREQSLRHLALASWLEIGRIVVVINKMDKSHFSREIFESALQTMERAQKHLSSSTEIFVLPASAFTGEGICIRSERMAWYKGPLLIDLLSSAEAKAPCVSSRLIVQDGRDGMAYGFLTEGTSIKNFDWIHLRSGQKISQFQIRPLEKSERLTPVQILSGELKVKRGDWLVQEGAELPQTADQWELKLAWFNTEPIQKNSQVLIRTLNDEVLGQILSVNGRLDRSFFQNREEAERLEENDLGWVRMALARPLYFDRFDQNRMTGAVSLLRISDGETLGMGMVV